MMDSETEAFLRRWVAEGVAKKYRMSSGAVSLIQEVLIEGFNERRNELWPQQRLGLSPAVAVSFADVERSLRSPFLGDSVWELVEEASIRGGGEVRLIDLLEAIHLRWCTSWPFCRPPEPPPPGM